MSVTAQRKPSLLVVELWALGDVAIAAPFLKAATEKFEVTLLAKPHADALRSRFFPLVNIVKFVAPWTAFRHKYRLFSWPWRELFGLRQLRTNSFEYAVSSRWDPRDHLLMRFLCGGRRLGFPRLGSQVFLTDPLPMPRPLAHRYDYWRALGRALEMELPARKDFRASQGNSKGEIVVHGGGSQPTKIWPLDRYLRLVQKLRQAGYRVRVLCDPNQANWWHSVGEADVTQPSSVEELLVAVESAGAFIGNDSGPGHVAALSGVPTFSLFGSGLSEWFLPLHPNAEWLDGSPCPYKPCRDYCRFPKPNCLLDLDEKTVQSRVDQFLARHRDRLSVSSPGLRPERT